jgi:hypothetical protein
LRELLLTEYGAVCGDCYTSMQAQAGLTDPNCCAARSTRRHCGTCCGHSKLR